MTYIERDFKEAYIRMKERALDAERDRDALVDVLQEARLQIEYLHEKFKPTGTSEAVLARIAYTLADVGGSRE